MASTETHNDRFQRAFLVGAGFILAATLIAATATDRRAGKSSETAGAKT